MVQPLEGVRDGSDVFHVVIEDLPGVGDGTSVAVDVASPGLASPGFWRIQHSGLAPSRTNSCTPSYSDDPCVTLINRVAWSATSPSASPGRASPPQSARVSTRLRRPRSHTRPRPDPHPLQDPCRRHQRAPFHRGADATSRRRRSDTLTDARSPRRPRVVVTLSPTSRAFVLRHRRLTRHVDGDAPHRFKNHSRRRPARSARELHHIPPHGPSPSF